MIRILLVPSSDYLGHPFPQRLNQIFEVLGDGKKFEVHVLRFALYEQTKLATNLVIHELNEKRAESLTSYYVTNAIAHAGQIRRIVRNESIDVVVLSNLAAPLIFTLMDTFSSLRVPTIFDLPDYYPTSAAGYILDTKKFFGRLLASAIDCTLRYILRRADLVTVPSHALIDYARRVGASNVAYVPNGISEYFLKLRDGNSIRDEFGYCREDFVVGYVGSVEFWLDMRSLLKGVALARRRGLSAKLLIVGANLQTDYSKKVAGWIGKEGLEKYTSWLGFIPHEKVPEYMASLDVGTIPFDVFNPTAYYASPNKMWEYLSQKKSVIATPIPEVLQESEYVLTALTPEQYAHKFMLVARKEKGICQKAVKGYLRALNGTWRNSAEIFGSAICALLNNK